MIAPVGARIEIEKAWFLTAVMLMIAPVGARIEMLNELFLAFRKIWLDF